MVNISHFLNLVRALAAAEDKRFPHHSVYSEFILSWLGLAPQTAEENRPEKDFYHLSSAFWVVKQGLGCAPQVHIKTIQVSQICNKLQNIDSFCILKLYCQILLLLLKPQPKWVTGLNVHFMISIT